MDEYQLGKDIRDLSARVEVLESKFNQRNKCNAQNDSFPTEVRTGVEQMKMEDTDEMTSVNSKSAHWDRGDAGDCEVTYTDLTIYEDGRYKIYHRLHDNGSVFGDDFTVYIGLFRSDGQVIASIHVCDLLHLNAGQSDLAPVRGDSRAIKDDFAAIDISKSKRLIRCN
jgi:hypothetical protein